MEIEIEIERVDGTSIPIKDEPAVEDLRKKLLEHSPWLPSCCIFRVPEVIRRQKIQAYEPNIVSIGPIHRHHRAEKFKLFEDVKRWYLHCLISSSQYVSLESLIKVVMELGKSARDCYAYPLDDLNEKDFVEMMILDGCFLLQLFRKACFCVLEKDNDPVFSVSCTLEHLYHDLLLLENQLPWSVLECLYNLTANCPSQEASLTYLVLNFFRQSPADELMLNHSFRLPCKILHILDLLRTVMVNGFEKKLDEHLEKKQKKDEIDLPQRIPNATSLSKAGIQFRKSQRKGGCIMNIEFNKKNGVFTIPRLGIDEGTEPLFRNLIAFEQCHHNRPHKITSYAVLMDNLIDSKDDVDFLCEKGILANWLNADDAAQFFNKLYNDTTVRYYYSDLSTDVNKYYKTKWHRFMAILRSDYFSTPWRIISFIAAFILLVLTLVQTLYTIRWP
ncbi:hypothetical protein L3X38_026452 [Prunus dulcis]|uniref:Uncharacterized protein n=1 Tax=Prunus dulcis TaxID=3755 RepID=A0AAD4VLZ6_PRUDU|nr:hypothetical protein L3X38_026452 [Prunus dulcis]